MRRERAPIVSLEKLRGTRHGRPGGTSVGRTARQLVAVIATAAVAGLGLSAPAWAALPGFIGLSTEPTHLGTMRPPGYTEQVICIDGGLLTPTTITSPTAVDAPQPGYLMAKYSQTTDQLTAAAVVYVEKMWLDSDPAKADQALASLDAATLAAVQAIIDSMRAEAATFAGPYSTTELHIAGAGVPTAGTVTGIGVQSASGAWVPGYPVTVTLSGPAVWDATGTATWTGTTGSAPIGQAWHATGTGTVKVSSTTTGLPGTTVWVYPKQATGYQRMIAIGTERVVDGLDPVSVPAATTWTPTVTTRVQSVFVKAGDNIADLIAGSGYKPSTAGSGTSDAYGPLASDPVPSATAPAGTPQLGTATYTFTADATGAFTATTTTLVAPVTGYYTWVEHLAPVPAEAIEGADGTYGASTETLIAYAPKLASKISTGTAMVGQEISDSWIPTGIHTTVGGVAFSNTLTGGIYGPVSPAADGTCAGLTWTAAPVASAITATTVTSDDPIPGLAAFRPNDPGCYSGGGVLTVKDAGGAVVLTVTHPAGDPAQTVLVTAPTMHTTASATVAMPGTVVTDTVEITGSKGDGKIEAHAWVLPVAIDKQCDSITKAQWTAAIADGTAVEPIPAQTLTITGDGKVTTPTGYTAAPDHCGTWTEKATWASAPGVVVITPPGEPGETTLWIQPTISTLAHTTGTEAGATLTDDVILTGTHGIPGTITGNLLIGSPVDAACTAVNWSSATVLGAITPIPTTADGTWTSSGITTPKGAAICPTFVETWTPTDSTLAHVVVNTAPGLASETVYLTATSRGSASLASTGSESLPMLLDGMAAIVLGGGLLLLTRRRHRTTT